METKESNRIIAEFMGFKVATYQNSFDEISHMQNAVYLFNEDNLPYHKDWNMLMPVVREIKKNYKRIPEYWQDWDEVLNKALSKTDITLLYNVVAEFAGWYKKHLEEYNQNLKNENT